MKVLRNKLEAPMFMNFFIFISFLGLIANADTGSTPTPLPSSPQTFPFPSPAPTLIASPYTALVEKMYEIEKAREEDLKDVPNLAELLFPLFVKKIIYPKNSIYVGTFKRSILPVPLSQAQALMLDFENYSKFFSGLTEVRVIARDQKRVSVFYERPSPVFFVANTRYEFIYEFDSNATRFKMKYQLKKANQIEYTDGVIFLEKLTDTTTLLTTYDFFLPNLGIFAGVGEGRVWAEALRGSIKGDFLFKNKLLHPDWKLSKLEDEADKEYEIYEKKEVKPASPKPSPTSTSLSTTDTKSEQTGR